MGVLTPEILVADPWLRDKSQKFFEKLLQKIEQPNVGLIFSS